MKTKVYLAASWLRREEMQSVAQELRTAGLEVDVHWLDQYDSHKQKSHLNNARADIRGVRECDVFVRYSDDLSLPLVPSKLATGGRFVEQGIAMTLDKEIFVVGGKQCIFDELPKVTHVKDTAHLLRELSSEEIH
jgi:hypothetical protein